MTDCFEKKTLLILLLFSGLFAWASPSNAQTSFTVGIANGENGGQILLPVTLSSSDQAAGLQFDILYNGQSLASDPVLSGAAAAGHLVLTSLPNPGRRRVVIFSRNNTPLGNGIIVEVPFTIEAGAPAGLEIVTLTGVMAVAPNGAPIDSLGISSGEITISAPIERPPTLGGVQLLSSGEFRFNLEGTNGRTFRIEVSTDLQTWTPLQAGTVTITNGSVAISDPDAGNFSKRFYRAVDVSNP